MSLGWKRGIALGITGLWIWVIFARSGQTAEESSAESAVILELLRRVIPVLTVTIVRKAAHFTGYFMLGSLLWKDRRLIGRGPVLLLLGIGCAVALVDELLIQAHTPGRSGELRDVLIDTAGVAAAIGLCALVGRRKERGSRDRT